MDWVIFLFYCFLKPGPLKNALAVEANSWKMGLCHYLNEDYKAKLLDMVSFINEYTEILSRPLSDLDDVRLAMESLALIQEKRSEIDVSMGPIEVRWLLLYWKKIIIINNIYTKCHRIR